MIGTSRPLLLVNDPIDATRIIPTNFSQISSAWLLCKSTISIWQYYVRAISDVYVRKQWLEMEIGITGGEVRLYS